MEDEEDLDAPPARLTIAVQPPIVHEGGTFESLELREPRVSEVQRAEEALTGAVTATSVLDSEIALVALVSGWPTEAVEELPAGILNRASEYLSRFEAGEEAIRALPEGATLEVELEEPVAVAKGSFYSMTAREPRVSERRRATIAIGARPTPAAMRRAQISLLTEISGWPQAAVMKMPIGPFSRAAGFVERFLVAGRRTGDSSRPT